jgi:hypothetical protein
MPDTALTLNVTATAQTAGAAIATQEIFDGATGLGPAPVTLPNLTPGIHNFKAVVTDSFGVQNAFRLARATGSLAAQAPSTPSGLVTPTGSAGSGLSRPGSSNPR